MPRPKALPGPGWVADSPSDSRPTALPTQGTLGTVFAARGLGRQAWLPRTSASLLPRFLQRWTQKAGRTPCLLRPSPGFCQRCCWGCNAGSEVGAPEGYYNIEINLQVDPKFSRVEVGVRGRGSFSLRLPNNMKSYLHVSRQESFLHYQSSIIHSYKIALWQEKKKGQNQIIPKWKIHFPYIWEPQLKAPSRIWLLHSEAQGSELTLETPTTSPFLMSGRDSGSPPNPQLHAACQPNKEFGFQWRGSSRLCSNISECFQTHWK